MRAGDVPGRQTLPDGEIKYRMQLPRHQRTGNFIAFYALFIYYETRSK